MVLSHSEKIKANQNITVLMTAKAIAQHYF